jgi:hypothetical protein
MLIVDHGRTLIQIRDKHPEKACLKIPLRFVI